MRGKPTGQKDSGGWHTVEPESDPLFYACFECPYRDCRYDGFQVYRCPFRIEWGRKHGVDPVFLAGLERGAE